LIPTPIVITIVRGEKSFLKETIIHELGHTLGLRHCNDLTCIMAVDNDGFDSGTFCDKCSRQIGFNKK
jgi:predicted Zn-dependent protease